MHRVVIIVDQLQCVTEIVIFVTIVAVVWVAPDGQQQRHKNLEKAFTLVDAFFYFCIDTPFMISEDAKYFSTIAVV